MYIEGFIQLKYATITKRYGSYNEFRLDLISLSKQGYEVMSFKYRLLRPAGH